MEMLRYGATCGFPETWADGLLQRSAQNGDFATIFAFVQNGNVDRSLGGNRTVLMHACANGHAEIVELLLESAVDTTRKDKNGHTAAKIATDAGYSNIAEQIFKHQKLIAATAG